MVREWARECWPAWGIGAILAGLVSFVAWPALVPLLFSMSSHYELRSVWIEDTVAGTPPRMAVDRAVHRSFEGRPIIQVSRIEGGAFVVVWECEAYISDWRPYQAGAVLPADLDLRWWLLIPPNRDCVPNLKPGMYQVRTIIEARVHGGLLRTMADSNVFTIHPAE